MLAIVNYQGDKESPDHFQYGTYRFEYVWEMLIDIVYGISNKEIFFRDQYGIRIREDAINAVGEEWKCSSNILRMREAASEWKMNNKTYEKVQGILVDVKHLMKISVREEENEIMKLAECINRFVN